MMSDNLISSAVLSDYCNSSSNYVIPCILLLCFFVIVLSFSECHKIQDRGVPIGLMGNFKFQFISHFHFAATEKAATTEHNKQF
jgi:hypothetical protein